MAICLIDLGDSRAVSADHSLYRKVDTGGLPPFRRHGRTTGKLMTKLEHTLLENIINSLDRLFDHENTVADVHDLLIATHAAVGDSENAVKLKSAADKVQSVLRSSMSPDRKRDAALVETDDFRIYLADILYRDSAS